jgi:hypothetical protein
VLKTDPAAGEPLTKGAAVTLTLAAPTPGKTLDPAAATWKNGNNLGLPFPGTKDDPLGFAMPLTGVALEDTTTADVLGTTPENLSGGGIIGTFTIPATTAKSKLTATVGFTGATPPGNSAAFVVRANGTEVARVPDTADGQLKPLTATLPVATTTVDIEVLSSPDGTTASGVSSGEIWKDLKIEE